MKNTITALALVAAILIETEPWSLLLLAVTVAVLLIAYRAYVSERTQRERVEFLYSSTKALRENSETTAAAAALLDEATSMFRAARGDLYVFARPEEPGSSALFRFTGGATVGQPLETDEHAATVVRIGLARDQARPLEAIDELRHRARRAHDALREKRGRERAPGRSLQQSQDRELGEAQTVAGQAFALQCIQVERRARERREEHQIAFAAVLFVGGEREVVAERAQRGRHGGGSPGRSARAKGPGRTPARLNLASWNVS